MTDNRSEAFWRRYRAQAADTDDGSAAVPEAWHFCDNRRDADALAELVCEEFRVLYAEDS